jgi:hypothetical protein
MTTFRFPLETRDYARRDAPALHGGFGRQGHIKASQIANSTSRKEDLSFLSGFFAAEAERRDWVERSRG